MLWTFLGARSAVPGSFTVKVASTYCVDSVRFSVCVAPCPEFYCKGGEYCIDSSKLLCNPLPRYCIAQSLRCNSVPNCGAGDSSDEDGCENSFSSHRASYHSVAIIVFTVGFTMHGV